MPVDDPQLCLQPALQERAGQAEATKEPHDTEVGIHGSVHLWDTQSHEHLPLYPVATKKPQDREVGVHSFVYPIDALH